MKIINLPSGLLQSSDYFVVDNSTDGVRKIPVSGLKEGIGIPSIVMGTLSAPGSSSTDITIPNGTKALIGVLGSPGFLGTVTASSLGVVDLVTYGDVDSQLTLTTSDNTLTVANASAVDLTLAFIDFNGKTLS